MEVQGIDDRPDIPTIKSRLKKSQLRFSFITLELHKYTCHKHELASLPVFTFLKVKQALLNKCLSANHVQYIDGS